MKLIKKILISGSIEAKTGLHIGGSDVGLSIGGADSPVIRDPLTNIPYIPGSSIKGKMRSLLEKVTPGIEYNKKVGNARIHQCQVEKEEDVCLLCRLFGLPAEEKKANTPQRLIIRDAMMNPEWVDKLLKSKNTDMPYTEVKTEVVIDRVTSAAMPRQIERIPAGAVFGLEMILNIYDGDNEAELRNLVEEGRRLVNDDYLGGSGTRGYGKVEVTFDKQSYKTEAVYKGDNQALPLEG
ncbi:MAG: type III-A CRISPR-associated RAMP protein Csm3 [archaeon]